MTTCLRIPGCQVKSFAASAKKSYSFSLTMPGGKRIHLAATDHVDLHRWFLAMDSATRVGDSPKPPSSDDGYVSLVAGSMELVKQDQRRQSTEDEAEAQVS